MRRIAGLAAIVLLALGVALAQEVYIPNYNPRIPEYVLYGFVFHQAAAFAARARAAQLRLSRPILDAPVGRCGRASTAGNGRRLALGASPSCRDKGGHGQRWVPAMAHELGLSLTDTRTLMRDATAFQLEEGALAQRYAPPSPLSARNISPMAAR